MATVPSTFVAVTAAMAGTYFFIKRRDRVMAEEHDRQQGPHDLPGPDHEREAKP